MENKRILLITILIYLIFIFLFWMLTSGYAKKKYGIKMWKHWPTRLSYWQALVLYSTGFTAIAMFILKWLNILSF